MPHTINRFIRRIYTEYNAEEMKKAKEDANGVNDDLHPDELKTSVRAEAMLFSHAFLNPDGSRVFVDEDIDALAEVYGPVHSRLLSLAIRLGGQHANNDAEAEKK